LATWIGDQFGVNLSGRLVPCLSTW